MTNSIETKTNLSSQERNDPIENLKEFVTTGFIKAHYNLSKKYNPGKEPERDFKFLFKVTPSTDSNMGRHFDIDSYWVRIQEGKDPKISDGGHGAYLPERFDSSQEERDACVEALKSVGGIVSSSYSGWEYVISLNNNPTYTDSTRVLVALFLRGLEKK